MVIGEDFTPKVFMGAGSGCAAAGFALDLALADLVWAWLEGKSARTNARSESVRDKVPRAE